MKFRIIEISYGTFVVERKGWVFWHRLKEWKSAGPYSANIEVQCRDMTSARRAIDAFCTKKKYPRVVQQVTLECK